MVGTQKNRISVVSPQGKFKNPQQRHRRLFQTETVKYPEAMTYPQSTLENQHHTFLIPTSGIERIALTLFVIACLLCPIQFSVAQEAQPSDPSAAETSTDETGEDGSASERLNPETDVPELER